MIRVISFRQDLVLRLPALLMTSPTPIQLTVAFVVGSGVILRALERGGLIETSLRRGEWNHRFNVFRTQVTGSRLSYRFCCQRQKQ